jgi:hypothetical protein
MTQQHPIAPPPELVQQWFTEQRGLSEASRQQIATRAAQWGADQELEACCEWLNRVGHFVVGAELRAARRPKPPSLKKQALEALDAVDSFGNEGDRDTIRRALESIHD